MVLLGRQRRKREGRREAGRGKGRIRKERGRRHIETGRSVKKSRRREEEMNEDHEYKGDEDDEE